MDTKMKELNTQRKHQEGMNHYLPFSFRIYYSIPLCLHEKIQVKEMTVYSTFLAFPDS